MHNRPKQVPNNTTIQLEYGKTDREHLLKCDPCERLLDCLAWISLSYRVLFANKQVLHR